MRHIISTLLENESGALSRVAGLFSARGYNIESLTVAPTEDPSLSRMTIVTTGSDDVIEQITKQLNKLVDVVKVVDLSEAPHIERELMLIKVRATGKDREEMKRMAEIFRGRILDVTDDGQGGDFEKGIHLGRTGVGDHEHVAGIDRLPAPDTGTVETETVFKTGLVEFTEGNREMLPQAGKVHEADVHNLGFFLLGQCQYVFRCHV